MPGIGARVSSMTDLFQPIKNFTVNFHCALWTVARIGSVVRCELVWSWASRSVTVFSSRVRLCAPPVFLNRTVQYRVARTCRESLEIADMCPGYQVSKQALTKTTLSLFIPPTDDSWARSGSPTAPGIPTVEIFLPN